MSRVECYYVAILAAAVITYPLELAIGPSLIITTLFPCLAYIVLRFCAARAGHGWNE
jgi:hypothetical protein